MADEFQSKIKQYSHQKTDPVFKNLKDYLDQYKIVKDDAILTGKTKATIVDQSFKQAYNVNEKKIDRFFALLDECREKRVPLSYAELQTEYSGIMLDFDILQLENKSQLGDMFFNNIINDLSRVLWKILDLPLNTTFYISIIKKPKVVHKTDLSKDQEYDIYKDGFHILIPGIQIEKIAKEIIYNEIVKNNYLNFTNVNIIDKQCKNIIDEEKLQEVMDKGSIRVPVLFVGNCKVNSECYVVYKNYKLIYKENNGIYINDTNEFDNCKSLCHEWSLCYKKSGGIIDKNKYELRESFKNITLSPAVVNKQNEISNNLNAAEMADPDIKEIRNMLKALAPERYTKYENWYCILCSLHSKDDKYKEVAREFSFNVLNYNPNSSKPGKFERTWAAIKSSSGNVKTKININTLYYMCHKDNPAIYEQMRNQTSISDLLNKIIKDENDALFTDYDYAKILKTQLGYKFCSVYNNKKHLWYEFITDGDYCDEGQIYKWVQVSDYPAKLILYINEKIPILLNRIMEFYKKELENNKKVQDAEENNGGNVQNKDITKHINSILKNLKMQKNHLGSKSANNKIIEMAAVLFNERPLDKSFLSKLDQYDNCLGVGNGILVLGEDVKLVTGYHDLIISKFTKVCYVPRSVSNKFYDLLIKFFKSFYLDEEEDVMEFELVFLASCLDFKIKEPILYLKKGNGANGKSTTLELMKGILGDYCKKLDIGFLVQGRTNAESASPAKMQMEGARLVFGSETEKNEELQTAKMKEVLGAETITGRRLHQDQVEFKPRCNIIVSSNYDFIIKMKDHGTWRRIYYYRHKIKFVDECDYDPNDRFLRLKDPRWASEYVNDNQCKEAFLNILCEYYKKYITFYDGRLANVYSPTMEREKSEYRNEQDFMNKFINEKLIYSPDSNLSYDNFVDAYSSYYIKYHNITSKPKYGDVENDILTSYLKDFVNSNTKEIEKHRIIDGEMNPGEMTIKDYTYMISEKKTKDRQKKIQKRLENKKNNNDDADSLIGEEDHTNDVVDDTENNEEEELSTNINEVIDDTFLTRTPGINTTATVKPVKSMKKKSVDKAPVTVNTTTPAPTAVINTTESVTATIPIPISNTTADTKQVPISNTTAATASASSNPIVIEKSTIDYGFKNMKILFSK